MQRIGVFVCHCGTNIAATVDVKKVAEMALMEPGVVHAEDYQYMCSEAGQAKIDAAIKEKGLTGMVVCSCSPRMHETTFRKAAERAGLNPYMVEIANIREHCSWIHKDMEEATKKAVILARAAIAKVNLNAPLTPGESQVTKRALVIGGGIAGIQTALDIADAGYEVDIVEKTPSIGGRMSFTEAEARIIEEMTPFISGEFTVSDIKRANYSELFPSEEEAADRWFKCKLVFITLDEKSGAEKKTSTQVLVQAADLRDAVKKLDEGMKGTMADYQIASVAETAIMDVYPYSAEPDDKPEV